MQKNITKVFLDLDGVLVDFNGGMQKTHGVFTTAQPGQSTVDAFGVTNDEFWQPINADWWANLDWTAEGRGILKLFEGLFQSREIYLLTAPPSCMLANGTQYDADAAFGKHLWVEKHLPMYISRLIISADKTVCANPRHLLVDDSDHNINMFLSSGGHPGSVLLPRPWNTNFAYTDVNSFLERSVAWMFSQV